MKKETGNIDNATKLKGKKLAIAEVQLVNLMGDDDKYEMYLNERGNIAFKLKVR